MNAVLRSGALLALCLLALVPLVHTSADKLTFISDTISIADVATSSSHVIRFTTTQAIPASGKIEIVPDAPYFTIPAALNYTDVDLAVSTGGPFTERTLSTVPSVVADGVAVVSGTSGSITITLNSTTGIGAGDTVRITIGEYASVGGSGDQSIINPSTIGSFHVRVYTRNSSNTLLDKGSPIIATTEPIAVSGTIALVEAIMTNLLPSGTVPAGSENIELSFNTDLFTRCRYATSSGHTYDEMTNDFGPSAYGGLHYVTLSGFQDNTTYTYYIRCITFQGVKNSDDTVLTFSLEPTPDITTSNVNDLEGTPTDGPGGILGPGGPGSERNGVNNLYRAEVTLSGQTTPSATVTVLKDGVKAVTVTAKDDGTFIAAVSGMERGTYTFLAYAADSAGRDSASYSATLTLGSGTRFNLSSILLPPTIELSTDTTPPGGSVTVSGESIPSAAVQILAQKAGDLKTYTASTSASGVWSFEISTASYQKEIYGIRARAVATTLAQSDFSKTLFLGVGQAAPTGACGSLPDMNGDAKVNLIDFSIFLLSWNTSEPKADFNCDANVNLADFSIMLFQWTG